MTYDRSADYWQVNVAVSQLTEPFLWVSLGRSGRKWCRLGPKRVLVLFSRLNFGFRVARPEYWKGVLNRTPSRPSSTQGRASQPQKSNLDKALVCNCGLIYCDLNDAVYW